MLVGQPARRYRLAKFRGNAGLTFCGSHSLRRENERTDFALVHDLVNKVVGVGGAANVGPLNLGDVQKGINNNRVKMGVRTGDYLIARLSTAVTGFEGDIRSGHPAGRHTITHPFFGRMPTMNYVRLQAIHARHHRSQLT